jgi:hypothetical protein
MCARAAYSFNCFVAGALGAVAFVAVGAVVMKKKSSTALDKATEVTEDCTIPGKKTTLQATGPTGSAVVTNEERLVL